MSNTQQAPQQQQQAQQEWEEMPYAESDSPSTQDYLVTLRNVFISIGIIGLAAYGGFKIVEGLLEE